VGAGYVVGEIFKRKIKVISKVANSFFEFD
jgi:hypothetical protein